MEVSFKDPWISGRHGRNKVDEDDGEEEENDSEPVDEKDDSKEEETVDEESEIGFLVTGTRRGRRAWLKERRRRQ